MEVAAYIVRKNYDADEVIDMYRKSARQINDISSWDIATHHTFIDYYVNNNYSSSLDPKRRFSKEVKDELYSKSPCCSHIDDDGNHCTITDYSKLEVDHITPWSKGGRTTRDNACLLCKSHNASKGNRD